MRWIRELFNPKEKCARLGHDEKEDSRDTYRLPESRFRSVADSCKEARTKCNRCGLKLTEWEVLERTSIQSLSMGSDRWDILNADGVLEL